MTDTFRFFKVSPRGFQNEIIYFRVPLDKVDDVEAAFDGYNDNVDSYCGWTDDADARREGVAVDWADRAWVGF